MGVRIGEIQSRDCSFRKLSAVRFTARNGNQTVIHLILLDVNDNAPQMPVKAEYEVDENADEVGVAMNFH